MKKKLHSELSARTVWDRRVEEEMPFPTTPHFTYPKVKTLKRKLEDTFKNFDKIAVQEAIRKRQDAQRYQRQTMRADLFMRSVQNVQERDISLKLSNFYRKQEWMEKEDMKKVS